MPTLPGAERAAGDFKQATYAEAGVLLLIVPLAALWFGHILPKSLEARAGRGALSFEWVAVGFASSFFLARAGLSPAGALAAGSVVAIAVAAAILEFRRRRRVRRLFCRRGRRAAALLLLAGASLDLARRSGLAPSRLFPADRLSELVLAGAALVILAASLCLLISRRPWIAFSRLGEAAWIPIAAAGVAMTWPATSPLILVAGLALVPLAALGLRGPAGSRWLERASFAVLVLACAWKIVRPPVIQIEYFEDGHSLFATQAYAHGARPYVDVEPIHGWGADGGVDSFCFALFGSSLRTFYLRDALWASGAMLLLAATCLVALRPFWGSIALVLCLSIGPIPIERQMLALGALLLLCRGARNRRPLAFAAAGALAAWELLHSLDFGVFIAAGGLISLALLPLLESRSPHRGAAARWSGLRAFALGLGLGSLPFLVDLAVRGSLKSFLRSSFLEMPRWANAVWGVPVGSFWEALRSAKTVGSLVPLLSGQSLPSLFLVLVLGVAAAVLLLRSASGAFDAEDRAAWITLVVAALAMRAVLGRADAFHYARYGAFVGVPAAWLLMRAWRGGRVGELLLLPAVILLLLRFHPLHTLDFELQKVEEAYRLSAQAHGASAPRSGGALVLAEQAASLTWFRQFVDARLAPGESFFDFNNAPALYFIADRVPPIPYCSVAQYESPERQREVIAALEKSKPPLALLPGGVPDRLDAVSNAERAPEVFRYLMDNYEPDREVSWIGVRKDARKPAEAQPPL